ncbi:UNVERIFIED_CONTAM: hypothetical protein PYX00_011281 [Menopon gallinae]|uniref:Uncharacterized protein n=1 Tax=Menopon gallinae TaxID=328185 RepID=A0AAW2H732_9NEOP
MTVIRLRTRLFCKEDSESIDCKHYVHSVVNKVYEELDESLESLRYTRDRKELARCHLGHSNLFKKMSLLFKILKYASVLGKSTEKLRVAREGNQRFVSAADRIAYMFEDMKLRLTPSLNMDTMLRLYKDYRLLYPRIFVRERQIADYSEIHRLIKAYLLKEDTSEFNVCIERGATVLGSAHFVFKLILCGDLRTPKWKLIDVNKQNRALWLAHLPSDMAKLNSFAGLHRSLEEARKIHNVLVSDSFFKGLVKGTPREFSLNYIVKLRLQVKGSRLACSISHGDKTEYLCRDIKERYEQETERVLKSIDKRARFSIEGKICIESARFCSVTELQEYLYREKVNTAFYSMFRSHSFIRNFRKKDFGARNVFMRARQNFVCIRLDSVEEVGEAYCIRVDVFVGKVLENNHLYYTKLHCCYNGGVLLTNSCRHAAERDTEGRDTVPASDLMYFVDKNLAMLWGMPDVLFLYEGAAFCLGRTLEIWLGEVHFKVAEENGSFVVNGKQLRTIQSTRIPAKDGCHHYRFRDMEFRLGFADRVVLHSDNSVLARLVPMGDFRRAVAGFYYACLYNIHPTFVCQRYLIFDFRETLGEHVVLRTCNDTTFFVKKSYFATSNFKLSTSNHSYLECSASNTDFFMRLRSIYLKERFMALGRCLKKVVFAEEKKLEIRLAGKQSILLSLENDHLHIEVDKRTLPPALMHRFQRIFSEEHLFMGPFVEMLGAL